MKKLLFSLFAMLFTVGCHAQVNPNPTVYTCPASTGTAYTPLNQSSPATGLTYTDSTPAAGSYCYIAQSVISSTGQVSAPSNIAGPFTLSGSNSVALTWTAPTTGPTPTGYIISRAVATASTLSPPTLGTGTTVSQTPASDSGTMLTNIKLTAQLQPQTVVLP